MGIYLGMFLWFFPVPYYFFLYFLPFFPHMDPPLREIGVFALAFVLLMQTMAEAFSWPP